jgi:hypothetical protein
VGVDDNGVDLGFDEVQTIRRPSIPAFSHHLHPIDVREHNSSICAFTSDEMLNYEQIHASLLSTV